MASDNINNPDLWKITSEERAKHNITFNQLNPSGALYLTGEQAKAFLLKSELPTPILGQIWNLSDLNKDGKLDRKEFSIACYLVKKVLNGAVLPQVIPSSLLIDPPQINVTDTQKAYVSNTIQHPAIITTKGMQPLLNTNITSSISSLASTQTPLTTSLAYQNKQSSSYPSVTLPTNKPLIGSLNNNPQMNTEIPSIPQTSRNRYSQIFQSHDLTSSGYINGPQAKTLLIQSGLSQQILAQIWQLSDYDNDGRLSLDEFIIAMHLCDYAKAGNILPFKLPTDLQPNKSKLLNITKETQNNEISELQTMNNFDQSTGASLNNSQKMSMSFEDKRKENFDKGNAVLEAKRQMLREIAEREKREREEKERIEQEKKFKLKEEQERKRLEEIEKQLERQRVLDLQREQERKKAIEQREAARQELIKQQRIEWERQQKHELENQKIKLHEHLSTLKAKDKNLEYDMQLLNEKIASSKLRIGDTQSNLSEINIQVDSIKKSSEKKATDCESIEKHVKELTSNLKNLSQEKLYLTEKLKHMNQDNPFAEAYRNESLLYKQEQSYVNQLRKDADNLELDMNLLRTQLECIKHEIEASKNEILDLNKENERLISLLQFKRNDFHSTQNHSNTISTNGQDFENQSNFTVSKAELNLNNSNNTESQQALSFFDDFQEPKTNVKNIISLFDDNNKTHTPVSNTITNSIVAPTIIKHKVLYNFEAQRDDEMSLHEGDVVSIDISKKTDDGWSWGTCNNRSGVFPTAFTIKLVDLDVIQEEFFGSQTVNIADTTLHSEAPFYNPVTNVKSQFNENNQELVKQKSIDNCLKVITIAPYSGKKANHLTFNANEIITVREQQGPWWSGELKGKIGWFPKGYVKPLENKDTNSLANEQTKNLYISIFPFDSSEPGDLNFGQYELIYVTEMNGEWFTGYIEDSNNSIKRSGIFPSNYARKFDFPIEYLYKYNIAIVMQDYIAQSNEECNLIAGNLIAIIRLSPDNQWSYGEYTDNNKQIHKGWFPTQNIEVIIPAANASAIVTSLGANNQNVMFPSYRNLETKTFPDDIDIHSNRNDQNKDRKLIEAENTSSNLISSSTHLNEQNPINNHIDQVIALYDFHSTTQETISFQKGAIINILEKNGDWWFGELNGQCGLLPYNYVQSLDTFKGSQR